MSTGPIFYSLQYTDQGDRQFLDELCHHMINILSEQVDVTRRLFNSASNLEMTLHFFIESYINNDILQMALFARCFYAQRPIFNIAYIKYLDFIHQLDELVKLAETGDLFEYMHLLACYELDMICKMNSYSLYFEPMKLQEECEMLLKKYVDNEEMHILQADIDLQLSGIWNKASGEYSDIRLVDCAYAHMWRGNIQLRYVRDRQEALRLYQEAVRKKPDYFIAWFQIGECCKQQSKYMYAIIAYQRVIDILADRYHAHVLSPMEITDLFMAAVQIAEISQFRLRNFTQTNYYLELARSVRNEIKYDRYFKLVWDDKKAYKEYFPLICNELDIRLNEYEYQVKEEGEIYYEYN